MQMIMVTSVNDMVGLDISMLKAGPPQVLDEDTHHTQV
jgi:hypothetical protein